MFEISINKEVVKKITLNCKLEDKEVLRAIKDLFDEEPDIYWDELRDFTVANHNKYNEQYVIKLLRNSLCHYKHLLRFRDTDGEWHSGRKLDKSIVKKMFDQCFLPAFKLEEWFYDKMYDVIHPED